MHLFMKGKMPVTYPLFSGRFLSTKAIGKCFFLRYPGILNIQPAQFDLNSRDFFLPHGESNRLINDKLLQGFLIFVKHDGSDRMFITLTGISPCFLLELPVIQSIQNGKSLQ